MEAQLEEKNQELQRVMLTFLYLSKKMNCFWFPSSLLLNLTLTLLLTLLLLLPLGLLLFTGEAEGEDE